MSLWFRALFTSTESTVGKILLSLGWTWCEPSKKDVSHHLSRATSQLRYPDAHPPAEIEMCLLSLEAWSLLFIDAARVPAQIDTISPQMGLRHADSKLRSGYVEGYGTSADMNCLRGCDHLLLLPLKFISKLTCDEAWRVCESLLWELWGKAPIYGRAGWKKWIVWLPLSSRSSTLSLPFPVFQIHLWGPLYGCMLFLLFLIKRKYWCLPDLLIGAIEKFMGCVFTIEAAFELSLT